METNPERQELLTAAKNGSISAFERVVSLYERGIFGYIFRLTGNRQDAEDLTQETFLKIYNSFSAYDPQRPFKTWAYTIATRTVYDFFRKKKIRQEMYIIDDEESGFETIDEGASYKKIDATQDLEMALQKIKPAYKSILLLHYLQGFGYEEITEVLGKPLGTVKTNLRRAKLALKDILIKDNG